jgi:hypothetical protein
VQAVHDHDDGSLELVIEPAVEGMVEPLIGRPPLGLRQRLLGLQRIVDDDQVGAPPGQHAADRGGEPAALCGRLEFGHRLPLVSRVGKIRRYQSLAMIRRQSRDNLSASSCA